MNRIFDYVDILNSDECFFELAIALAQNRVYCFDIFDCAHSFEIKLYVVDDYEAFF